MFHLTQARSEGLYILSGATCVALALFVTLGTMFSSIGAATLVVLLIDIPLLVGLSGTPSRSVVFSGFVLFGATCAAGSVFVIYVQDIYSGLRPTSFFFETPGWIYLAINLFLIILTCLRIKSLRGSTSKEGAPK